MCIAPELPVAKDDRLTGLFGRSVLNSRCLCYCRYSNIGIVLGVCACQLYSKLL